MNCCGQHKAFLDVGIAVTRVTVACSVFPMKSVSSYSTDVDSLLLINKNTCLIICCSNIGLSPCCALAPGADW